MLYDPRKDFTSVTAFRLWLESRPSGDRYVYADGRICACSQYLTERLGHDIGVTPTTYWRHADLRGWRIGDKIAMYDLPLHFDEIAKRLPHTFGAAAKRARAFERVDAS